MDRISIIEDLLVAEAKAVLTGATVETRTVTLTEDALDEMVGRAPFCYIEYLRGMPHAFHEGGASSMRKLFFNVFVASKSLRSRKEGQRGSYEMLEQLRLRINGKSFSGGDPVTYAGPFTWEGEDVMYDSPNGGTVYMQVFSTLDPNI